MENIGAHDQELGLTCPVGTLRLQQETTHAVLYVLTEIPRHLPTDAVLLLLYQNPSVWTTGICPELNLPTPLLSPDASFSFLRFSRLRELTFLPWQVPPCRHTFPWKLHWSGFWTLSFSPILSLSPDLFYELAWESVFVCVKWQINRTKKKPLTWSSQWWGRKSFQRAWSCSELFLNTSISPPSGKDYPDVVLI